MDWNAVLELVVTVVFLAGIALALLCLVTIHRNPYFSEVQKLKWLLLVLCLPYVGPVTWLGCCVRVWNVLTGNVLSTSVRCGVPRLLTMQMLPVQLPPAECPIVSRSPFRNPPPPTSNEGHTLSIGQHRVQSV